MNQNPEKRKYKSTDLPTLKTPATTATEVEWVKQLYSEVHSNYRHLADIRFKLLGFVPAVSVIVWVEILGKIPADGVQNALLGLIAGLLGLIITFGIRIYDKRNDKLYDDLISRGRKIEEEAGVDTGIFRGRLEGHQERWYGKINHGRGLSLIYTSVFIGWGLVILWYTYPFIATILS